MRLVPMEKENETQVTEFILLGLSWQPNKKLVLFVFLLIVYLVTLTANILLITVTLADSCLHSPMYFFLCNLAFLDLLYSSSTSPTFLEGLLAQTTISITFSLCIAQMFLALGLGGTECFLLAVMAWDRYVAICKPLRYHQIMNNRVCLRLAIITWASGFFIAMTVLSFVPVLKSCGDNIINHMVCELQALSRLNCKGINYAAISTPLFSLLSLVVPLSLILLTYFRIIVTILRIPATATRRRTFSTCGSHLVVVTLFYGTAMGVYLKPNSVILTEKDKEAAFFYGMVVPALNPLIYTLRNKEVIGAMKNLHNRNLLCQKYIS
ncbi:olfactory receptor 2D2-like [Lissotriton helveticus]